jgi:hypothetical protein
MLLTTINASYGRESCVVAISGLIPPSYVRTLYFVLFCIYGIYLMS